MAGGLGSRLAPLTTVLPKPLMPLSDRPIIDVLIRQLVRDRVDQIDISVGHLGGLIEAWVNHDADYGVPIGFLYENEPLGTAGALRTVPDPGGTFLAMNGDILTDMRFGDLSAHHEASGAVATMAVKRREVKIEYGVVHTDGDGNVARLEEKPTLDYTVSMGIYAFDPRIIDLIEPGERIDFPDLLLRAIGRATSSARTRSTGTGATSATATTMKRPCATSRPTRPGSPAPQHRQQVCADVRPVEPRAHGRAVQAAQGEHQRLPDAAAHAQQVRVRPVQVDLALDAEPVRGGQAHVEARGSSPRDCAARGAPDRPWPGSCPGGRCSSGRRSRACLPAPGTPGDARRPRRGRRSAR